MKYLLIICFAFVGCAKTASQESSTPAASSTLSLSPNLKTGGIVAISGSISLAASGGTSPYTFDLISTGGYLLYTNGTSTVFVAPNTAGTAKILVTDSASPANTETFYITVAGSSTGTGVITLSPQTAKLNTGDTTNISASGGQPPYSFTVLNSASGHVEGQEYFAPATGSLTPGTNINVIVQVSDSAGNFSQVALEVAVPNLPTNTTCPTTGYYNGPSGQYTPCTPGQAVSPLPPNSGYPYQANPAAGSGCMSWSQMYGQQYVPIYLNGQLVCANYNDLIASMQQQQPSYYSYYQTTPYYQDPSYYYAYPPYSGGGGCSTSFAFSYGGSSAALCF